MKWSIIALVANFVLNVLAYKGIGLIGPAITTFVITTGLMVIFLSISAKEIGTSFQKLFDWREVSVEVVQMMIIGGIAYGGKRFLYTWIDSYVIVLVIIYCLFIGAMFLINKNRLIGCIREINSLK